MKPITNRMLIRLKYLIIFSFLSIIIFACTKNNLKEKFLLTDEIKKQNPYVDGQTVFYIDSSGTEFSSVVSVSNKIQEALVSSNSSEYYLFEEQTTKIGFDNYTLQMKMYYEPKSEPLLDFYIRNNSSYLYMVKNPLPLSYSTAARLPSLEVNGVWYYQVYYFESNYTNSKIYYSTEFGIIRVEFETGQYLEYVGEN